LPANRAFTGGARLASVLLEQPNSTEDYIWMGPVLRGYGISQFQALGSQSVFAATGSSFAGVSLTASLPGFSIPLFSLKDVQEGQEIAGLVMSLTARTRARAFSEYLESETDPEEARRRAQKRVDEIKRTLRNLLINAKVTSVRPLGIFDYGALFSRRGESVRDWSAGGGVRLWTRGSGMVEFLYARNGGAIPAASRSNLILRYTIRPTVLLRTFRQAEYGRTE
jgi:hypothetical protein